MPLGLDGGFVLFVGLTSGRYGGTVWKESFEYRLRVLWAWCCAVCGYGYGHVDMRRRYFIRGDGR